MIYPLNVRSDYKGLLIDNQAVIKKLIFFPLKADYKLQTIFNKKFIE